MNLALQQLMNQAKTSSASFLPAVAILAVLTVVYWSSMRMLLHFWDTPDYSHGYLVPPFAAFLLWIRRDMFSMDNQGGAWLGAILIFAAALFFVAAGVLGFKSIGAFSIIPAITGIVLMVGGWGMLRWSWPAILFLVFMIPLPVAIEAMATQPLRRIGTMASTYILQTMGLPAIAEGNVIQLSEQKIGVAEACSGLRMLMSSAALAFGLAFMINRPIWERGLIVLSAIPIAIITNVIRIVVTGICYEYLSAETAEHFFHDLAGYFMMPIALGLLWLEMEILSRLTIERTASPTLLGPVAKPAR
jgi:exosortase